MDQNALYFYTVRSTTNVYIFACNGFIFRSMSLPESSVCYFRRVCINREKSLLLSSCLSVRLSACIRAALTGQIFVKFVPGGF